MSYDLLANWKLHGFLLARVNGRFAPGSGHSLLFARRATPIPAKKDTYEDYVGNRSLDRVGKSDGENSLMM